MLALGAMAANPALHAWAHHGTAAAGCTHRAGDSDHAPSTDDAWHQCAVTLFAQGLTFAVPVITPAARPATWESIAFPVVEEQLLTTPRYLHRPERGPPVA